MSPAIGALSPKQRAAWWALEDCGLVILEGAVRSGKSVAADHAFVDLAAHGPQGNLLLAGRTQDTVIRNVIHPLMDVFGEHEVYFNRGSRELRIHGRRVYVVGANDERAQEKIRGLTLVGAYVDEASTIPESFWMMLRTRLSAEGSRMIATTNPDAPLHWLKRDWLDRADELGVGRFSFRLEDNPHLPDAYVESVKREFTGLWYRRFILGEWVAAEGAVFDMFDPVLHVSDELPAMQTWWLFVDYGTATVTHALLAGLGTDERLYVAREWRWDAKERRRQLTDAEYSVHLRDWLASGADGAFALNGKPAPVPVERAYVDPSAVSFSAQLRRDGWVKPREAENDVLDGIRYTATLLTSGRLCIHRSCTHLIRELTGYRWDAKAQERGEDSPVKADDHGCFVAGTPVVTSRGQVAIERVRTGDKAMTRDGWREVRASVMTCAAAKVHEVVLSDGRRFSGTADHPVWVEGKGWVSIDALRYGDILRSWSRSSSSTESGSGATRPPTRGPRPFTSLPVRLISHVVSAACMRKSGRRNTAGYRTAASSTMPISTRSTTSRPISSVSRKRNTAASTPRGPVAVCRRLKHGRISRVSGRSHPNGIAPKRAAPGTVNTLLGLWRSASRYVLSAATAAGALNRSSLGPSSVPTTAEVRHGVPAGSMTRPGSVSSAARVSGLTATCRPERAPLRVLTVRALTERVPVYNLLIADAHEFYANGVLVHNCDALRYGCYSTRRYTRRWLVYDTTKEAA